MRGLPFYTQQYRLEDDKYMKMTQKPIRRRK